MIGQTTLSPNSLVATRVSADNNPQLKPGGVTIDWTTVAALGADTTFPDGSIVRSGQKVLRYGQVLTKNTTGTSQTLTGTATAGNFTLSLVRPDNGATVVTGNLAFNATAAQVLAALQAVLEPEQVVSTSGGPLGTGAVTINFGGTFPLVSITNSTLTGGTVTPAVTVAGSSFGLFGPFDPAAADGRQTITRGACYICDETTLQFDAGTSFLSAQNDQKGGMIEGGLIWIDRVIQSGTAAHSLAAGPTLAEFLTAFPAVRLVQN